MNSENDTTAAPLGWGEVTADGSEIWDAKPVFRGDKVTLRDWAKLIFYPKKFWLYRWVRKEVRKVQKSLPLSGGVGGGLEIRGPHLTSPDRGGTYIPRVLDVGCGTGASVIDLKKMLGRGADVVGVDVVRMEVDIAQERVRKHGVWAEIVWYDGAKLPFPDGHFDALYSSDVLGHVEDVETWLLELERVLKPGGLLAMFSESKLGKHAFIRNYLYNRGLNVDPHAQFHISLFSKKDLRALLVSSGFVVERMWSVFWASFFVHPDECFAALQGSGRFFFLRQINRVLFSLKKRLHPYSTAAAELYGFVEMLVVGCWVESQGYVIRARKIKR